MKREKQSPEKIRKSKNTNHLSDSRFYKLTYNLTNGDIIRIINKSAKFIKQEDEDALKKLDGNNLKSRKLIDALNSSRSGKNYKKSCEKKRKNKQKVQKNRDPVDKSSHSAITTGDSEKNINEDDYGDDDNRSNKSEICFEQESYVVEEDPKYNGANDEDHYSTTTAESLQMDHSVEDSDSEKLVFHVITKTGAEQGDESMNGDIFIKLIDENALNSGYIDLSSTNEMEPSYMKLFQNGSDNRFIVTVDKMFRKIEFVLVGLKDSLNAGSWFLECIEIQGPIMSGDTSSTDNYIFPCRRWIGEKSPDSKTEITLQRISPLQSAKHETKSEDEESKKLDCIDNKYNNRTNLAKKTLPPLQSSTRELNSANSESKELDSSSSNSSMSPLKSSKDELNRENRNSNESNCSDIESGNVANDNIQIDHQLLPTLQSTKHKLKPKDSKSKILDSGDSESHNVANDDTVITKQSSSPLKSSKLESKSKELNNSINKPTKKPPVSLFGPTIHEAVTTHDYDRVKELYELYPNIIDSEDPKGRKPIHLAVIYLSKSIPDSLKILEYFLKNKVNLNVISGEGLGLLHYCVLDNNMLAAQKLMKQVEVNFDVTLTDRSDTSALILALKRKKLDMANFLMQYYDKQLRTEKDERIIINLLKEFDHVQLKRYNYLYKLYATPSTGTSVGHVIGKSSHSSRGKLSNNDYEQEVVVGPLDSSDNFDENQDVGKLNGINSNMISNKTAAEKRSSKTNSTAILKHDKPSIEKGQLNDEFVNVPSKVEDKVTSSNDELSHSKLNNNESYIRNKANRSSLSSTNDTISLDKNEEKLQTDQLITEHVQEQEPEINSSREGNIKLNDGENKQVVNLNSEEDTESASNSSSSTGESDETSNSDRSILSLNSPGVPLQSTQINDTADKVTDKTTPEPVSHITDNNKNSLIKKDDSAILNDEDDIYKTLPNEKEIPVPDKEESSISSDISTVSSTSSISDVSEATTDINSISSVTEDSVKKKSEAGNSKKTHNVHFSESVVDRKWTDQSPSKENEPHVTNDPVLYNDRKSSKEEYFELTERSPKKRMNQDSRQ